MLGARARGDAQLLAWRVVVAHTKTNEDGIYRVGLAAGRYFVTGARPVRPQQVSVGSGGFRRVDFTIDTGIR